VLFAKAVVEFDWKALGYESVGDWAVAEFGHGRFSPGRRKEIVDLLTKAGLTTRAIAAATGSAQSTVVGDQREARDQNRSREGQGDAPPPATPRQQAAREREAFRRLLRRSPPVEHAHVWDRCACGAVRS
jgi:hypothetical protein